MPPRKEARHWIRSLFTDHPGYGAEKNSPEELSSYVHSNKSDSKIKTICTACLPNIIADIQNTEERASRSDPGVSVRTYSEIESARKCFIRSHIYFNCLLVVWAVTNTDPKRVWIESRSKTLLNHAVNCKWNSEENRQEAKRYLALENSKKKDTGSRAPDTSTYPVGYYMPPPSNSNIFPADMEITPRGPQPGQTLPRFYSNTDNMPSTSSQSAPIPIPFPLQRQASGTPVSWADDSPSQSPPVNSGSLYGWQHFQAGSPPVFIDAANINGKRARLNSHGAQPRSLSARSSLSDLRQPEFAAPQVWNWTDAHQARLEWRVARLTASADLAFSWIESPEWLGLLDDFIPYAKPFDRKQLSGRILKKTLKEIRDDAKRRAEGCMVTLQCDGWTGHNKNHLVAFMMSSGPTEEVLLLSLHKASID